jgi:queuine/archaeosine tRNA-ribosyltransferase
MQPPQLPALHCFDHLLGLGGWDEFVQCVQHGIPFTASMTPVAPLLVLAG